MYDEVFYKSQIAREVLQEHSIDPASVLSGIGYNSVDEIAQASHDKRVSLGANYHFDTWKFLANASEKRIDKLLAATPWLLAGLGLLLAITQGYKLYAIAAFGVLLVNSIAKRWAEVGNAIGGISLTAVIGAAIFGRWVWASILLAMLIASFCGRARVMWYSEIIAARALLSDEIFAVLFFTNRVNVRDNTTGKQIFYKHRTV